MKKMLFEEKIIAVVLCLMVVMVAAQVLSRYVLHTSLSHTEEIVRYCFVWITFLGISAATFRGKHLSVAGALNLLPAAAMTYVRYGAGFAAFLFSLVLVGYGVRVVLLQFKTGQKTAALGFPMWIIGLAIPVCALIMAVRLIMIVRTKGRYR